jgi:hypothetical protein
MTPGALTNVLAETVDAPSEASALEIQCSGTLLPRLPSANALTLTTTALNRTCLEAFGITSSFAGTVVPEIRVDRVSDYSADWPM